MAPEIEIAEDLQFQQRYWQAQRVGWVLLAVVLVVAALGFFGSGPFNTTTAGNDRLTVEYPRFVHRDTAMMLVVRVHSGTAPVQNVRLVLDADYLRNINIENITPRPERVETAPGRLTFQFAAGITAGELLLHIEARPRNPGLGRGHLNIEGLPGVDIRQVVYP